MQPTYQRKRRAQLSELLREKIALILMHKSRDPRLARLTITDVSLSPDLRQARVFFIVRTTQADTVAATPDREELARIQTALTKAAGFIKQEIAQLHVLRLMPQISFEYDTAWQRGENIDTLLRRLVSPPQGEPPSDP